MSQSSLKRKQEILQQIKQIIHRIAGEGKVFLFGSQSGLDVLKRADLDIGLDYGRVLTERELIAIQTGIEQIESLYPIEIIDFAQVDNDFKEIALQRIEIL